MAKPEPAGWIKIHRQLTDHWLFEDAIKLKCWLDILFTVNTEDKIVKIGYQDFECKRGQSLLSIQSWATRWKMSKGGARNILNLFKNEKMIKHDSIGISTRLTVCKYEDYQCVTHAKKTTPAREMYTTKEDIIINNNIGLSPFDVVFNDFVEMRKKMKKPLTVKAVQLIHSKLEKFSEGDLSIKIQILEQSIEHGWLSVFPLKPENFKQQKINGHLVVDQSGNKNFLGV